MKLDAFHAQIPVPQAHDFIELTVPGLVQAATAAIEAGDLEGYRDALVESLRNRLDATSPRASMRFMKSPAGELASLQCMLLDRIGSGGLREISGLGLDEAWASVPNSDQVVGGIAAQDRLKDDEKDGYGAVRRCLKYPDKLVEQPFENDESGTI